MFCYLHVQFVDWLPMQFFISYLTSKVLVQDWVLQYAKLCVYIDFQFSTKRSNAFIWLYYCLFLAFFLMLYHLIQIDDWRDIAMPRDHTRPPRVRTLGVSTTISGFGLENVGKVYLDNTTYVIIDLIDILITHLTFVQHTYALWNTVIQSFKWSIKDRGHHYHKEETCWIFVWWRWSF